MLSAVFIKETCSRETFCQLGLWIIQSVEDYVFGNN